MDDIKSWRAAQRTTLIAARLVIADADRRRWTNAIEVRLRAALSDVRGLAIGYYMPFRGEPDLRPLLDTWRAAGAETALPVVVARGEPLEFRRWWPGAPVRKGAFSLPMPDGTPLVAPQVVLLPPVGFDARGYRLGYGGGYFDRTLAALVPTPLKIGVAFEVSRIATIYPQPYDIAMDYIVTEAGVYRAGGKALVRLDDGAALVPRPGCAELEADELRPSASSPCYAAGFPSAD